MSKTLPLYVSKTSSVLIAWQDHITSERMVALISFLLNVVASLFKSKIRLEAENAALRHQLIVLQRKVRGRVPFTNSDRLFFVQLYRWFPSVLDDHPARDACALASCRPRRIVAALRETIIAFFEAAMVEDQIVLPYAKQGLLGDVYENARVLSEDYDTTGRIMKVRGLPGAIARLRRTLAAS